MDLIQVVDNLTEEMYLRFKSAVETGKWPEGAPVEQSQRESAMQIVMAYQARRLDMDEIFSVGSNGEIVDKTKSQLRREFKEKDSIARFKDL
ncbi:YeaC family protein [Thalassotalea atypica]|uniref:YeaC family protein n=1 Tax=Thalassotalea atypica TaxID=2054316 RepID=UPI002573C019|nr:DUF1315 family protein [Thalassotalea atypica]